MGPNRTTAPEAPAPQPAICRPRAHSGSRRPDRDSLRVTDRPPVEHAATRDGLWIGHDLLASARPLATRGRLEAFTHGPAPVAYTHLRAHETPEHLVCRLL